MLVQNSRRKYLNWERKRQSRPGAFPDSYRERLARTKAKTLKRITEVAMDKSKIRSSCYHIPQKKWDKIFPPKETKEKESKKHSKPAK
jgi:hypothetical protein